MISSSPSSSSPGSPTEEHELHVLEIELRNAYTVRGIKSTHEIASVVRIFVGPSSSNGGKIARVEDRWGGDLPEGKVAEVGDGLSLVHGS